MRYRLVVILSLFLLSGCDDGLCGNESLNSADAPDGRHRAVLFQRDCGATTGFSRQVAILREGEELSGKGNVFAADGADGPLPRVHVKWTAADQLQITYDEHARVYLQENEVMGVHIEYAHSTN